MYERIVAAALNESRSIKDLAEALYEEIGDLDPETPIEWTFDQIREAIRLAGGEPKSRSTLTQYWKTAQWVWDAASQTFAWAEGVSFGTHNAARMAGMKVDQLGALAESDTGATIETVKQATVSTSMRRHRFDHDLARALRAFAGNVERYSQAGIPADTVHWKELLNAYHRAEQAMRWIEKYLEEGD